MSGFGGRIPSTPMTMRYVSTVWIFLAVAGHAASISLTGSLDPNNANDVLFYSFTLSAPSMLTNQSYGYGGSGAAPGGTNAAGAVIPGGGFDTYLSLFDGVGATAAFVASNDDGLCPPGSASPACHDSTLVFAAHAGPYTLVLGVFDNFSFAENFGGGTLGDGFIGLGDYFDAASGAVRTSNYAVDISAGTLVVAPSAPEPANLPLALAACIALVWRRSR
jgi:hypothetical protein